MKSMRPLLVAIFFMTYFHRARGGHGPLSPPLDPLLCVPPACSPYLPVCTAPEGGLGVPAQGSVPARRCTCRGVTCQGSVPAQGVPAWEVYLPEGCTCPGVPVQGVYLPRGSTCLGGVPAQGCTCPGTLPPINRMTDRQV